MKYCKKSAAWCYKALAIKLEGLRGSDTVEKNTFSNMVFSDNYLRKINFLTLKKYIFS